MPNLIVYVFISYKRLKVNTKIILKHVFSHKINAQQLYKNVENPGLSIVHHDVDQFGLLVTETVQSR